jgi:hypothetical protein
MAKNSNKHSMAANGRNAAATALPLPPLLLSSYHLLPALLSPLPLLFQRRCCRCRYCFCCHF